MTGDLPEYIWTTGDEDELKYNVEAEQFKKAFPTKQ